MPIRYRAGVAVTSLLLLFSNLAAAPPRPSPSPKAVVHLEDIYSPRVMRRVRSVLEMRLLELREERLERVERALERHEPIDRIIRDDSSLPPPC